MATIDDLRRQQQISQQQSESLSERLEKLDQVTRVVDPQIRASALDFTNRPVLSNPLNDVQMALELGEASRSERSSALADLTAAQDRAVSLADKVDVMSRRGGGGSGKQLSPIELLMQKAQVMQLAKENPDLVRLDPDTFSQALGLAGINTQFTPDTPQGPSLPGMEQGSANTVVSLEKLLGLDQQQAQLDPLAESVASGSISLEDIKDVERRAEVDRQLRQAGVSPVNESAQKDRQKVIDVINKLREGNISAITGISTLGSRIPAGSGTANLAKQLNSILALENREKLRGSGTISDFEARMLADAASALGINERGVSNLGAKEFKEKLDELLEVFGGTRGVQSDQLAPQPSPSMGMGVILQSPDGQIFQYDDPNDPEIQEALQFGYKVVQ